MFAASAVTMAGCAAAPPGQRTGTKAQTSPVSPECNIAYCAILPIRHETAILAVVTGLRERKKRDTRRALSDATLTLALERGLASVTREEIADLAGVSVRTFTNYFAGKYDALAYRQQERLRSSIELLRTRPIGEPLWDSITAAVLGPLEADLAEVYGPENSLPSPQQLVEVRKLLMAPELRDATYRGLADEWVDAIAERTDTDPQRDMYPHLAAAVLRAVGDVAMDRYSSADPPVPLAPLLREGFAAVAAGLPEPGGRR